MKFVYHMIPNQMTGKILYPLNEMQSSLPEVYEFQKAKYQGRESLMEEKIPYLNCKWNDVVHFAPIDPRLVYKKMKELGLTLNEDAKWFKIPVEKIDSKKTVIYKYEREDAEMTDDQVLFFDSALYSELTSLPEATIDFYKKCAEAKRRPLLFHRVPHILMKSKLDISDCEIIEWVR